MKRHAASTRLWHWGNAVLVVILFMSGLTISNAHPWLYWGQWGFDPRDAWLAVPRFPDWMTIPGYYSLAAARDWHIAAAWPYALLLLFAWAAMLVNRRFARDIATCRRDWRLANIRADITAHLRFDFDHGTGKYNFLQKLSYGAMLGVVLPGLIFTGIAISPGMGPSFSWAIDLMGGRQSARSLHFIFAFALLGFTIVHVLLVLVSGPRRQIRAMIDGRGWDAA
ncbi:cytochrome b/b6 domain-containing protein [Qipengyuania sediminis]|uniref:cytochrome b/b6 domain-containing protein n=1 Tax=Qipengyuania sediminis TaxID=1532023 RepID=UPI001059585D|nr:cytochrome b/b6 domain-containing protein [Qipengyuania sediminis]